MNTQNDNNIENKLDTLKNVRLSVAEKTKQRAFLHEYAMHTPIAHKAHKTQNASPFSFLGSVLHPIPFAALSLILFVGVGTSYAAEGALPGNPLYPIKVSVNEEIRGVLSLGAESKANWELARAERRISEAAELEADGDLTEDTRLAIDAKVTKHTEAAQNFSEHIEIDKSVKLASIMSRVETTLAARDRIVLRSRPTRNAFEASLPSSIAASAFGEEDSSVALLSATAENADSDSEDESRVITNMQMQALPPVAAKNARQESSPILEAQVRGKLQALRERIHLAQKVVTRIEGNTSDESLLEIRELLIASEEQLRAGENAIAEGSFNEATLLFEQSLENILTLHKTISQIHNEMPREERPVKVLPTSVLPLHIQEIEFSDTLKSDAHDDEQR